MEQKLKPPDQATGQEQGHAAPENAGVSLPHFPEDMRAPGTVIPSTQKTAGMEIHQHGHVHEQTKWKEYVFQFFMLFLAVFCGFLAENKREHYIEHQREKTFMRSLVADIKTDTANLNTLIAWNKKQTGIYDSLTSLLKSSAIHDNVKKVYYYFQPTTRLNLFSPSTRTIDQLKNSGGFRLVRNIQTSDSISNYYAIVKNLTGQGTIWYEYFNQYHEIAFTVFDYSQIEPVFYNRSAILQSNDNYSLLTTDVRTLKILWNKLYALRFILASYIGYLEILKFHAESTLDFLQKEYHFK